jgi:Dehydrogenase E1 component
MGSHTTPHHHSIPGVELHENPLLPNAKLKELHALMQRARSLSKVPASAPRFEAILAATLMHVEPGDFICPPPNAPAAALLAAERATPNEPPTPLPAQHRLATTAGVAQGLKLAANNRFAVFYTDATPASARTEAGWQEALTYATEARLPLILIIAGVETASRSANPKAISWPSVLKLAKPLKLPVLTVDGSDAVAVYRVMQESAHRARLGDGAAVIWCALPGKNSSATDPIRNMERYLAARNLLPRPASKKNRS